ncbi:MBL fold metallo-hydrolase [Enterococcus faecalis]|uniref:MBL fold metallo-hydrolase n=1 Tax=Enterococcus faecalis TaxID=1351 RepID=UPI001921438F|nr:MBL fold metallo-hydrolase [Enterococcus faecalis]MDV5011268.1 MBL fold metallo-hydrolase [Enterococcus faecium]UYY44521.1 MBL fold metallo-hydrolase [Enterococcus faecalis]HCR3189320.1 MBL fold metallo-hydrolase [Enterococcus faecalis]
MEIKKLTERIFYLPHNSETDRPLLAYIKGDKIALAVDAGNSAAHVNDFYQSLKIEGLKKPDITVITHWHWDHTFGMHHINGISIAHHKTNKFLENEKNKLSDSSYIKSMKKNNKYLNKEYVNNRKIVITQSDVQFEKEIIINLGGMTAQIFHTEAPHSEDTVLIYIPEEKVLFLGDSTSEDFFNNGYMDTDKLRILTNLIERTDCKYCILGHTEPLSKDDLLLYLKSISK